MCHVASTRFRIIILVRPAFFFPVEKKLLFAFHELPGRTKGRIRQDNYTKTAHLKAYVQFGGNEELTEEFLFKKALRESIGKALQLSAAPKLDMSHLKFAFTGKLS